MNVPGTIALATLLAANALVWRVRAGVPERGFDDDAFIAGARETFDPFELERIQFEEEGLLPPGYVYLEGLEETPWISVYAGYFAGGGLLREEPHDPAVCYVALGFSVVEGPAELQFGGRVVKRIVVERDGESLAAYYWQQRPADAGMLDQLLTGRTDLVWVRVELEVSNVNDPTTAAALTQRIESIARAAAAGLP